MSEIDIIEFKEFPKIPRLSRRMIVTEKIDGTNAAVIVTEDGQVGASSRTRLITPQDDNYGFAAWVESNRDELLKLGPGRHFGEWWGAGIQKRYGQQKQPKTFSLFNVSRWCVSDAFPSAVTPPSCCSVVPVLLVGMFGTAAVESCVQRLIEGGSIACPGAKAEGVIVFHEAANTYFKKTLEKDEQWKGGA